MGGLARWRSVGRGFDGGRVYLRWKLLPKAGREDMGTLFGNTKPVTLLPLTIEIMSKAKHMSVTSKCTPCGDGLTIRLTDGVDWTRSCGQDDGGRR